MSIEDEGGVALPEIANNDSDLSIELRVHGIKAGHASPKDAVRTMRAI